uniref:Transmembrane protein 238a n=2 Tax=Cyprinus carpio carpio TaxID=630221 RepID=A0A8C1DY79_CYPCA
MDWSHVDYFWIIVMFLSAVWTLILTAPIHSRGSTVNMACAGLKHCKVALGFAVIFDIFGFTALFLGLFVPLEMKGRDFGDLLVYTGALMVLISLGGWVMWYSGNIEGIPTQKDLRRIGNAVDHLARSLSKKIYTHRVHREP